MNIIFRRWREILSITIAASVISYAIQHGADSGQINSENLALKMCIAVLSYLLTFTIFARKENFESRWRFLFLFIAIGTILNVILATCADAYNAYETQKVLGIYSAKEFFSDYAATLVQKLIVLVPIILVGFTIVFFLALLTLKLTSRLFTAMCSYK